MTNHIINDQLYLVSNLTMETLPEKLQIVVRQVAEDAASYHTKLFMEEEINLKNFFKAKGMIITEPELDEFKTAMQPIYDEYSKKNGKLGLEGIRQISDIK